MIRKIIFFDAGLGDKWHNGLMKVEFVEQDYITLEITPE